MLQELAAIVGRRWRRLRQAMAAGANLINETTYWLLLGP